MSLTPLPPWRSVLAVVAHPDHAHATAAAVHVADTLDLPVLGWTVPDTVAATLREEHRAPFHGHAVNGPAYGADETFNAVRLAAALSSAGCDRGCSDFRRIRDLLCWTAPTGAGSAAPPPDGTAPRGPSPRGTSPT